MRLSAYKSNDQGSINLPKLANNDSKFSPVKPNNVMQVIFKWNEVKRDYDLTPFRASEADYVISNEDITLMFNELRSLGKIYQLHYCPRRFILLPLLLSILIIAILIIGIILSNKYLHSKNSRNIAVIAIAVGSFGLGCVSAIGLVMYSSHRSRKRLRQRFIEMSALLKVIQETLFGSRDVKLQIDEIDGKITIEYAWKKEKPEDRSVEQSVMGGRFATEVSEAQFQSGNIPLQSKFSKHLTPKRPPKLECELNPLKPDKPTSNHKHFSSGRYDSPVQRPRYGSNQLTTTISSEGQ